MKKNPLPQPFLMLLAALALALPVGLVAAQDSTDAKLRLSSEALSARENGDLATAKVKFEALLALDPANAEVRRLLDDVKARIAAAPAATKVAVAAAEKAAATEAKAAKAAADAKAKEEAAAAKAEQRRVAGLISIAQAQRKTAAAQVESGDDTAAAATLTAAAQSLAGLPAAQSLVAEIEKDKADLPLAKAMYLAKQGETEAAQTVLKAYGSPGPETAKVAAAINQAELHPPLPAFEKSSPDYIKQQKDIARLIATGRSQYLGGNINGAQATFRSVTALDPTSAEANYFLKLITEQQVAAATQVRETRAAELLLQVTDRWNPPSVVSAISTTKSGPPENSPLAKKLDSIVIPVVNFNNMAIDQVVQILGELAAQSDPATEHKGVNLMLSESSSKKTVKIQLRDLSLRRVLDAITTQIGYQYEVQADIVVLSTGGGSGDGSPNLANEAFSITKPTLDRILGTTSAGSAPASDPADVFAPPAVAGAPAAAPVAASGGTASSIQSFLQSSGVNFSGVSGASLSYDGASIIVEQTPRNLDKIRNILNRYNDIKQVSIETKFIEVQEGALQETGVNWNVSRNNGRFTGATVNRNLNQAFSLGSGGTQKGQIILPTIPGLPAVPASPATLTTPATLGSAAVPSYTPPPIDTALDAPALPEQPDLGTGVANLLSMSKLIGTFDITAVVRALDRKSGTELLSAPSVTVLSGNPASITVAQELRYPQSYGEPRSTAAQGGAVSVTPGTPQEFTTRNVGIELHVTPTVEEDNYSISLDLHPQVTEFEGFVEYGGQSVAIAPGSSNSNSANSVSTSGGSSTVITVPSGFFQPVFSVREVETKVTIWDGATLVMGGLTREQVKKVSDKVPILGSIPLIGKLFQSKGETTEKRNLLIFVTANLVSPGGSLKKQDLKGVPRNSIFQNPTWPTPGGVDSRIRSEPGSK